MEYNLLGEVSVVVNSTANGGKLGEADAGKLSVVGDLETTTNRLEHRHADGAEVDVADKGERSTDFGEVRGQEGRKLVAVESKRTVQAGKRWERDRGNVTDSHVVRPVQVGKRGRDVVAVGLEGQGCGDVAKLHVDEVEVVVLGNEHGVDDLQVDTSERVELGVLDRDTLGSLNTCGEGKRLKGVEDVPVDGLDIGKAREVEVGENGQTLKAEGVGDGLKGGTRQRSQASNVVGDQGTLNLLNPVEGNVVGGTSSDGNATGESCAAGESGGIASVLNGGGGSATLSCVHVSIIVHILRKAYNVMLTCYVADRGQDWEKVLGGHCV